MRNQQKWQHRFIVERTIREFFWSHSYIEVRTPLLVQSPGMEPHIKPIELKRADDQAATFLPTSPEFAMKKLLARGLERIFQICSSFRDEPRSREHHPEFTMLEFYEVNLSLEGLQNRVEDLFRRICLELHQSDTFQFQGKSISLAGPWKRFRVVDLFQEFLAIDLRTHETSLSLYEVCKKHQIFAEPEEPWDDLYFKLWLNLIEPKLPTDQAYFVTHYPLSQSSLCNPVIDERGYAWANRFEVYVGMLELGNAFDELRDPEKQRANFLKDQKIRAETYGSLYPTSPIDEELLQSIEKMPPTSGIALGVDRICMLMLDAQSIDEVLPLQSYW